MSEAEKCLLDLQNRLELIYRLCCGTAPKQSIGELIDVMRGMQEWNVVQAALAAPVAAAAPNSVAAMLEGYAESYEQMGRTGNGKVDCISVATDIRQNMIPAAAAPETGDNGCKSCAILRRYEKTARERGYAMGKAAGNNELAQAQELLAFERKAHAETNAALTAEITRLEAQLAAAAPGADAWKEAVIEQCIVAEIGWDDSDPRKSLQQLITWETQVALDPRVSSEAQALIDRGRNESLAKSGKDANRYRWLRDQHIGDDPESINLVAAKKPGLDAAIDAAMKAS